MTLLFDYLSFCSHSIGWVPSVNKWINKCTNSRIFLLVYVLLETQTQNMHQFGFLTTGTNNDSKLHLLFTDTLHTHDRYRYNLLFSRFFLFPEVSLYHYKFPLRTALLHQIDLASLLFHFHLSLGIFYFLFDFLSDPFLFSSILFSLHVFVIFTDFFL